MEETASYTMTCQRIACTRFTRKTILTETFPTRLRVRKYIRKVCFLGNLGTTFLVAPDLLSCSGSSRYLAVLDGVKHALE